MPTKHLTQSEKLWKALVSLDFKSGALRLLYQFHSVQAQAEDYTVCTNNARSSAVSYTKSYSYAQMCEDELVIQ